VPATGTVCRRFKRGYTLGGKRVISRALTTGRTGGEVSLPGKTAADPSLNSRSRSCLERGKMGVKEKDPFATMEWCTRGRNGEREDGGAEKVVRVFSPGSLSQGTEKRQRHLRSRKKRRRQRRRVQLIGARKQVVDG